MASVRPCGYGGWAYCDGRCWTCQSHASVATTFTQQIDLRLTDTTVRDIVVPADGDMIVHSKEEET